MDAHLKVLFARFHEQFGSGPGLGPGSPTCLLKVDSVPPAFIRSLFRASAALFRTDPWKRLRPAHLFSIRIGKDSEWTSKKQPFPCALFVGGDGGDLGLLMFRSPLDAERLMPPGSRVTVRVPNVEVLRVTYEQETLICASNRQMIRSLSLEASGSDRFPTIDVARCTATGGLRFRNPTVEELKFVYAFMRAILLVHPLLQEGEGGPKWARYPSFEPFIETVDVQWPPEVAKGGWDAVAVTISHPPGYVYEERVASSRSSTPSRKSAEVGKDEGDGKVSWTASRQCVVCEKETHGDQSLCCGRCRAVVYCGPVCQKQHWKESHKTSCGLYKAMMEREEELAMKGFLFPCFHDHPCKWLESLGLHQKGMWRRKCSCYAYSPFGLLGGQGDTWEGLAEGEYPPDSPVQSDGGSSNPVLLSGWLEYYNLRSLPLSSPVAAILSHPLTVYYILTTLSVGSKNLLIRGKEVVLHYIGPEIELDWMPAFTEMGHLLNGSGNIQLIMVGPQVPSNLSGTVSGISSRVRVNFVRGVYQEEATYLPSPHVIVALNCGIESGGSWAGALELIKSLNVPTFLTDKTEISCANAKQVLRAAGLHITLPVTPNPFRSPVRGQSPSNNLPSFSNGFLFGVNT